MRALVASSLEPHLTATWPVPRGVAGPTTQLQDILPEPSVSLLPRPLADATTPPGTVTRIEQLMPGLAVAVTRAGEPRLTGDVTEVIDGLAVTGTLGVGLGSWRRLNGLGCGRGRGHPHRWFVASWQGQRPLALALLSAPLAVEPTGCLRAQSGASVGTARPPVVGRVVETAVVVSRGSGLLSLEQATVKRVATMETVTAAANQ